MKQIMCLESGRARSLAIGVFFLCATGVADHGDPRQGVVPGNAGTRPASGLPREFRIEDWGLPLPYQKATSQCIQFAATGVMEWLVNRAECRKPVPHGEGDLSEIHFHYAVNGVRIRNYFTDVVEAFKRTGYVLDREMPFRLPRNGVFPKWPPAGFDLIEPHRDVPDFGHEVVFNHPGRGAFDYGGVTPAEIARIKEALVRNGAPILFVYRPTERDSAGHPHPAHAANGQEIDYWHANVIVGFNEKGFIMRDSAFGKPVRSSDGGEPRRDTWVMPYAQAMSSAKHATSYFLNHPPPCPAASGAR